MQAGRQAKPTRRTRRAVRDCCIAASGWETGLAGSLPGGDRHQAVHAVHAVDAARLELISFDTNGCSLSVGTNHAARSDELKGANAIQPRRPVHAQLHDTADRQFFLSGEENPAAANV